MVVGGGLVSLAGCSGLSHGSQCPVACPPCTKPQGAVVCMSGRWSGSVQCVAGCFACSANCCWCLAFRSLLLPAVTCDSDPTPLVPGSQQLSSCVGLASGATCSVVCAGGGTAQVPCLSAKSCSCISHPSHVPPPRLALLWCRAICAASVVTGTPMLSVKAPSVRSELEHIGLALWMPGWVPAFIACN